MQWLIHMTLHEVTLEYKKYSKAKPQQSKVAASEISSTRVRCIAWFLGDKPPSYKLRDCNLCIQETTCAVDAFSVRKTGDALSWYLVPVELGHMLFLSLTCDISILRNTFDTFDSCFWYWTVLWSRPLGGRSDIYVSDNTFLPICFWRTNSFANKLGSAMAWKHPRFSGRKRRPGSHCVIVLVWV